MAEEFRPKPERAESVYLAPGAKVASATPLCQPGPEHVDEPTAYEAILLLGFGGPEGQDDVIPFLRNVTRGRGIPDERLEEVAHHYRHFGGVSPINEQNRQLRDALQTEIDARGINLPVYWGNRNWMPYVSDAVQQIFDDGHRKVLAIATSAYSSFSSCRQYREDLADALAATGLAEELQIDKVAQFFNAPGFIAPFVEGLAAGLAELRAQDPNLADDQIEVLFSTHSIPNADADRSGPPEMGFGPGGAYEAQHKAVAQVVIDQAGAPLDWQLVYQSRSGPPQVPWLEPDVNDAIAELPGRGKKAVAIVPLGFVSDHMEVMWDLDTEALETAAELGLAAVRTATPGVHPTYVSGLVDLLAERIEGTPAQKRQRETSFGPWFDTCRTGCCENARLGFKPALAGLQP